MDELAVLEPQARDVTYRGERLEIRPLTIGQLPKLVRASRPVIDTILALDAIPGSADPDMVTLLLDLVEQHAESIFAAASICTGKPQEWVAGGDIDEFIDLAKTIVEVNRDFFVQRLAPLLAVRVDNPENQAAASQSDGTGKTPSNS